MKINKAWGIWEGDEVEGRLLGIKTVFFHTAPLKKEIQPEMFNSQHFYFCLEWIKQYGFKFVQSCVEHGKYFTIEVTPKTVNEVPSSLHDDCHLMLCLDIDADLSLLKENDTVRITRRQFHTYYAPRFVFLATYPKKYGQDKLLFPVKRGGQIRSKDV
jgi:hypothetical protein